MEGNKFSFNVFYSHSEGDGNITIMRSDPVIRGKDIAIIMRFIQQDTNFHDISIVNIIPLPIVHPEASTSCLKKSNKCHENDLEQKKIRKDFHELVNGK